MRHYIGIDIGGTKSAAALIDATGRIVERKQFPTMTGINNWQSTLEILVAEAADFIRLADVEAIGISCGGPLDSEKGLILSPPNLPGWDEVPIRDIFAEELKLPTYLENDANAGALAEWKFGAGKGVENLVFLTFGTGLGAGIILDGRLYKGTNDLGGEVGHIRLADDGPLGYHKRGSFEGFCSGPGLAELMTSELMEMSNEIGREAVIRRYRQPNDITGKNVVDWAHNGDPVAIKVVEKSGRFLGAGLAIMIDILNPQMIIVSGMGVRLGEMLLEPTRQVIKEEALPQAVEVCAVVPGALGDRIGDLAALCVALGTGGRLIPGNSS
ncbi:MAG: ROK family protein [Fidelibacterota bacterium]|nr:MAG: ROK family protein [Candidatus Neomarinimicrobiota bacterium]